MSSKRQSVIMIGIGLIIIGCVILGFALSQPKIAVSDLIDDNAVMVQNSQTENNYADSQPSVTVQETVSASEKQTQSAEENGDDTAAVSYPINLNTCTAEELMTISGIGEVKAADIIAYRDYLGGYTSVEQINIEKWKKQILDYEIEQPFKQLSTKTKNFLIKKIPNVFTVGIVKNIADRFSMIRDDINGVVTRGYVFYDDYNDASIYIKLSNVYYASNNNDETEIEIKFNEYADERFKYGFYLILSLFIK